MKVMLQKRISYCLSSLENFHSLIMFYDIWITNLQYSPTSPFLCSRDNWQLSLNVMLCKVYSPWTDFACSFPSVLFLFIEVFGAFSVKKGEKYNIMEYATRFGNPQIDLDGCLNICFPLSLPDCLNVTTLKTNLAPSNLCLHTSNSILSQYLNLINVKKYKLFSN